MVRVAIVNALLGLAVVASWTDLPLLTTRTKRAALDTTIDAAAQLVDCGQRAVGGGGRPASTRNPVSEHGSR